MKKITLILILISTNIYANEYVFNLNNKSTFLVVQEEEPNIQPATCGSDTSVVHSVDPTDNLCNNSNAINFSKTSHFYYWNCENNNSNVNCQAERLINCKFRQGIGDVNAKCSGGVLTFKVGVANITGTCTADLYPIATYIIGLTTYNKACVDYTP